MFVCPHCRTPLNPYRSEAGRYYGCPECHGRGATLAFLRRASSAELVGQLWSRARISAEHEGVSCPVCSRSCRGIQPPEVEGVFHLDVCTRCQFIWFDPGELEALPKRLPPVPEPASEPLPASAREAFARAELKRIQERHEFDKRLDRYDPPSGWWRVIVTFIGLPVEAKTNRLARRPLVTWGLGGVMALVGLFTFLGDGDLIVQRLGFLPERPWRLGGLTLISSFFVHAGVVHILGNLWFLITFGDDVEDFLGHARYGLLVAMSAFGGLVAHLVLDPRGDVPLVGASAGISGVLAFYAFRFPMAMIVFMPAGFLRLLGWFRTPVILLFIAWIGFQLIGATFQVGGFGAVSALAHLGGVTCGLALWLLWSR